MDKKELKYLVVDEWIIFIWAFITFGLCFAWIMDYTFLIGYFQLVWNLQIYFLLTVMFIALLEGYYD